MTSPTGERFELRLRDVAGPGDERPATQRLRTALKILLRVFGLRCESVGPATTATATQQENAPVPCPAAGGPQKATQTQLVSFDQNFRRVLPERAIPAHRSHWVIELLTL